MTSLQVMGTSWTVQELNDGVTSAWMSSLTCMMQNGKIMIPLCVLLFFVLFLSLQNVDQKVVVWYPIRVYTPVRFLLFFGPRLASVESDLGLVGKTGIMQLSFSHFSVVSTAGAWGWLTGLCVCARLCVCVICVWCVCVCDLCGDPDKRRGHRWVGEKTDSICCCCFWEYWSVSKCCIWVNKQGLLCMSVCVCVCVCSYGLLGDNGRLQY